MINWIKGLASNKNIVRMASLLVVTLTVQYCEYRGMFANMEGAAIDLFLSHSSAEHSPIIVVQIDDVAYKKCFASTSPLNPERLESLVNALLSVKPDVLGVDIITDVFPASQAPAYRRLAEQWAKKPRTVWAAAAEGDSVVPPTFFRWLIGARDRVIIRPSRILGYEPGTLPSSAWGPSIYIRDDDLRLRKYPRSVAMSADTDDPAMIQQGVVLARRIAEFYCLSHACKLDRGKEDEVYFSYSWPIQHFDVERLFQCHPSPVPSGNLWPEFALRAPGSILLLGETFSTSKDFYLTPVGRIAGLHINAQAVNSEINGTGVADAPRYFVLILDLAIGCLIVLAFTTNWGTRRKIEMSFALVAATSLASGFLMTRGFVWLTWIGMALGLFPHIVWELYHSGGHGPAGGGVAAVGGASDSFSPMN
jgi:hypothetical protein